MALTKHQVPLVHFSMAETNEYAAGALIGLLELTTILTGWLLDINPVDQPAVELGKRLANAKLGAPGYPEETKDLKAFMARQGELDAF